MLFSGLKHRKFIIVALNDVMSRLSMMVFFKRLSKRFRNKEDDPS